MRSAFPTLSLAESRAMVLRAQGLGDEVAPFGRGKAGVLRAIEQLGYVQVDTVSVLQRAHHHVLWSRVPDYQPAMLHELQSPEARIFEYWSHAASYLPMADYRFSLPLMRRYRSEPHWSDESPDMLRAMRRLLRLMRKNGALKVSDIETTVLMKGWSETQMGKIERRALHELWMRGDIMIESRHGFQKVFDLKERVLPEGTDTRFPSSKEAGEFHVRQTLRSSGVARLADLSYLRGAKQKAGVVAALKTLTKRGEVVELRVEGDTRTSVYALCESLESHGALEHHHVRFLSPFDNLVIQRKRLKWLFDFDYTIEIYVPPPKRKYGYFVLPILWGDRLVARMDAKAFRPERKLVIHNLVFEPGFNEWKAFTPAFREALDEFMRFQGCDRWELTKVEPKTFRLAEV